MTLFTMLAHPNRFFNEFHKLPPKWFIAYIGYYLLFFELMLISITNEKIVGWEISSFETFLMSLIVSIIGALFFRLNYGVIWLYIGSKIFGGHALSGELGNALGYILLPFGTLGLVMVPAALIPSWIGDETIIAISMLCVVMPVLLLIYLAILFYSAFAVKQLNGFGWLKTIGVISWYPIVTLLLTGVILICL